MSQSTSQFKQRELKFRYWYGNTMEEVGDIQFFTDGQTTVNGELVGGKLMQFTGLKDKNGTDIYEGDVVKYTNPYNLAEYTHLVRWYEGQACFGLFEGAEGWCQESDWLKICDVEVIGNIHQSPELLARKKKEV